MCFYFSSCIQSPHLAIIKSFSSFFEQGLLLVHPPEKTLITIYAQPKFVQVIPLGSNSGIVDYYFIPKFLLFFVEVSQSI